MIIIIKIFLLTNSLSFSPHFHHLFLKKLSDPTWPFHSSLSLWSPKKGQGRFHPSEGIPPLWSVPGISAIICMISGQTGGISSSALTGWKGPTPYRIVNTFKSKILRRRFDLCMWVPCTSNLLFVFHQCCPTSVRWGQYENSEKDLSPLNWSY